jgi:hypothetical protein
MSIADEGRKTEHKVGKIKGKERGSRFEYGK